MGDYTDIYEALNRGEALSAHATDAGEHTGWSMAGIGADAIGFTQALAEEGSRKFGNANLAQASATPIIRAGLLAMMVMRNMCGYGDPEKGDLFTQGSEGFESARNALESTSSPASWRGEASNAYDNRNRDQQLRAEKMAEIDKTVRQVLDDAAEQVDVARKMLDRCQTTLTLSIPAAIAAKAVPPHGPAVSTAIELAAVAATLPPANIRFSELRANSIHNATLIRRAGASYDEIASDAQPS